MAEYRVAIIGRMLDQQIINTFAFQDRTVPAADALADLTARVDAWVTSTYSKVHSSQRTFSLIDVRQLGTLSPLVYAVTPATTTGGDAGAVGNPAEAVVMSLKSVFASRRRNGRIYFGGVSTGYYSQGKLTSGATPLFNTFVTSTMALFGPNGTEPYRLGIWSDPGPDKQDQPRAPFFTPVAQMKLNLITGSQRRRRIGVGG